jgi:hypothetical protein
MHARTPAGPLILRTFATLPAPRSCGTAARASPASSLPASRFRPSSKPMRAMHRSSLLLGMQALCCRPNQQHFPTLSKWRVANQCGQDRHQRPRPVHLLQRQTDTSSIPIQSLIRSASASTIVLRTRGGAAGGKLQALHRYILVLKHLLLVSELGAVADSQ